MRNRLNTAYLWLCIAILVLCCGSCSGSGLTNTGQTGVNGPGSSFADQFPAPNTLRMTSANVINVRGRDYEAGLPNNKVTKVGNSGNFTPAYGGSTRALSDAAYAVYTFDVSAFTGDSVIKLTFSTEGTVGTAWMGLADYGAGRWDWTSLPAPSAGVVQLSISLTDRDDAGTMPVAMVFTGTDTWKLDTLELGAESAPEPGPWPMLGQNIKHDHVAPVAGAQSNSLLWRFNTSGPGTQFVSVATGPDGKIYAGAGSNLVCYDIDGTALWGCGGVTPNTVAAIKADGTVYVGGKAPNMGLHAISSTGQLLWTFDTTMDVYSNPAIGPDGRIYFGCDDGKFYALESDGTKAYQKDLPSSVRGCPAVGPDGSIYVGYQTSGMSPIPHLLALNPDGTQKYDIQPAGMARGKPAVDAAGNVYGCDKDGNVFSIDSTGGTNWSTGSHNASAFTACVLGADGTVYVGSKGGKLIAINPANGSQKWAYTSDSEVLSGPLVAPDGSIVAASTNGTLFACNASGTELWTQTPGGFVYYTLAVNDNDAILITDTGYLNAVDYTGALDWQVGAGGSVTQSAVIAADGTLYLGCSDGSLYAVRPNGTLKWRFATSIGIACSPAIGADGTVFIGSRDSKLHAINPDGTQKWELATNGWVEASPAIDADGKVYFGSNDTYVYAVNADGTSAWSFKTKYNIAGSPAVDANGKVYAGSWDRYVYCIDKYGQESWKYKTLGMVKGGVTLGPDGRVYACSEKDTESGVVTCLTATGSLDWTYTTDGPVRMTPAIAPDGTVYVASSHKGTGGGGAVYALSEGGVNWQYAAASADANIAIGSDGKIYVGSADGKVVALDDNGSNYTEVWKYEQPGATFYSVALAAGRTYVGTDNGLAAFGL